MKKTFSAVFAVIMIFSVVIIGSAAKADAELYSFYSDGMLFRQNEEAVIAGKAPSDSIITAVLYNSFGQSVAGGECVTGKDGEFTVCFDAPAGSYEQYSIVLEINGEEFETLENVVFGELWLATGQSNMQYPLAQDKVGVNMFENKEKLSERIRVLLVPAVNEYKGSTELVPAAPQKDIAGAQWVTGENEAIYNMSAVAYFFAASMIDELNMPVGVLNAPLGGSAISSWISRKAIDGNEAVKNDLISLGEYYAEESWNEAERSIYYDMTSNYNLKIEPLRHFRLSGMIWYQGETDIIFGKTPEQYARMFDLMQQSYTEVFDYKNGLLPIVYTQLAAFRYLNEDASDLLDMNIGFTRIQSSQADSRAVVSIYDIPLTYTEELGAIHPDCKQEIGERMADSAMSLVYSRSGEYTAPMMKDFKIEDGKIYVTIESVGDGLVCKDKTLRGFAIADKKGIFVQADAQIVSDDTVVIYNEKIKEPVAASYAYALGNMGANLYATESGELSLPVSPFVTAKTAGAAYWFEKQWAACDKESVWHLADDNYTDYYKAWTSDNAVAEYDALSAAKGESGLRVKSNSAQFGLSPVIVEKDGAKTIRFHDETYDYSNYGSISFSVRNNGCEDIVFNGLRFYVNAVSWYKTTDDSVVIPADGRWHKINIDINSFCLYGVDFGIVLSNNVIANICGIDFLFEGKNADLSFDEVEFGCEYEDVGPSIDLNVISIGRVAEIVKMFISSLADYLKSLVYINN